MCVLVAHLSVNIYGSTIYGFWQGTQKSSVVHIYSSHSLKIIFPHAALWNIPASTCCWWGRASSKQMTTIIRICHSCDSSCSVLDERLFPVWILCLDYMFLSWSHNYWNTLNDTTNTLIKQPMRSIPFSSWFVSDVFFVFLGFFAKLLVWKSMHIL